MVLIPVCRDKAKLCAGACVVNKPVPLAMPWGKQMYIYGSCLMVGHFAALW